MNRLFRLAHLPTHKRMLILRSTMLVGAIRVGLWLLPLQTLRRALQPLRRVGVNAQPRSSIADVTWGITRASQLVPRSTCLTQALAAQALLAREGLPSRLRIGFARDEAGVLRGHAWLECEGQVVVGGYELERYSPAFETESVFVQERS
jgi:hypothetical protein